MEDKIDTMMNLFKEIGNEYTYKKICELNKKEKEEYRRLLEKFKQTNSSQASTEEKGKSLEELATFVINSAHIFEIYQNIRTSTNELDQLIRINDSNRHVVALEFIDKRLKNFIGECKNYKTKVSVTYVGKICSLLTTTQNKICVLFSYNGVTGNDWNDASGLIKKFYLSKENSEERFCIIDFNINDFEDIAKGNNFLQIIENKIEALRNDTNYLNLMSPHELEARILEEQKI